jgi:hypothetical protein
MQHWRAKVLVAALVLLPAPFVVHQPAAACSPAVPVPEPTNPANVGRDGAPPVILNITVGELRRGAYDRTDTCSDIGWLWLDIDAEDDLTPAEMLRYRVQDLTQDDSFYFDEPVPWFSINWIDDGKMALDFRLRVFAVDRGGNESDPFDIRVRDGDSAGGCNLSTATSAPCGVAGLLLFALAAFLRRGRAVRARSATEERR